MLDRREEHVSAGNRPNSLQRVRIGAKQDGTLTAIDVMSWGTGGIAGGAGIGFCYSAMYPCPNMRTEQYDVFTNAGPCAAFRAPGRCRASSRSSRRSTSSPSGWNIDPLILRDRIDTKPTDDMLARAHERQIGGRAVRLEPRGARRTPTPGRSSAASAWRSRSGCMSSARRRRCEVRVADDGSVAVFNSAQDIGTGTRTVLAQVVAEEFGLNAEDIGVVYRRHAVSVGTAVRRQPGDQRR